MTEAPYKCIICGRRPKQDDEGWELEEVYFYQRIDGKLCLCDKGIVLGSPMYAAHAECRP